MMKASIENLSCNYKSINIEKQGSQASIRNSSFLMIESLTRLGFSSSMNTSKEEISEVCKYIRAPSRRFRTLYLDYDLEEGIKALPELLVRRAASPSLEISLKRQNHIVNMNDLFSRTSSSYLSNSSLSLENEVLGTGVYGGRLGEDKECYKGRADEISMVESFMASSTSSSSDQENFEIKDDNKMRNFSIFQEFSETEILSFREIPQKNQNSESLSKINSTKMNQSSTYHLNNEKDEEINKINGSFLKEALEVNSKINCTTQKQKNHFNQSLKNRIINTKITSHPYSLIQNIKNNKFTRKHSLRNIPKIEGNAHTTSNKYKQCENSSVKNNSKIWRKEKRTTNKKNNTLLNTVLDSSLIFDICEHSASVSCLESQLESQENYLFCPICIKNQNIIPKY